MVMYGNVYFIFSEATFMYLWPVESTCGQFFVLFFFFFFFFSSLRLHNKAQEKDRTASFSYFPAT